MKKPVDPKYLGENGIHRVPLWRIGGFALNNTATNLYLCMMNYVSYFLMGCVGVGMVLASSFSMAMRLWDGFTDPVVGYILDKTNSRFGKNRPFMILGNLILCAASYVLFHVTQMLPEGMIRMVFFVPVAAVYYIGYTFQCVVTKSAQSCVTNDPKQRPLFAAFDGVYTTLLFSGAVTEKQATPPEFPAASSSFDPVFTLCRTAQSDLRTVQDPFHIFLMFESHHCRGKAQNQRRNEFSCHQPDPDGRDHGYRQRTQYNEVRHKCDQYQQNRQSNAQLPVQHSHCAQKRCQTLTAFKLQVEREDMTHDAGRARSCRGIFQSRKQQFGQKYCRGGLADVMQANDHTGFPAQEDRDIGGTQITGTAVSDIHTFGQAYPVSHVGATQKIAHDRRKEILHKTAPFFYSIP